MVLAPGRSAIAIFPGPVSHERGRDVEAIDTSSVILLRMTAFTQRSGLNTFDIVGKAYNTITSAIVLESVEYSPIGFAGPWIGTTILTGDPAYNFPTHGSAAGDPFNVPIEVDEPIDSAVVWIRMKVSY